jgi:hypothetical protein
MIEFIQKNKYLVLSILIIIVLATILTYILVIKKREEPNIKDDLKIIYKRESEKLKRKLPPKLDIQFPNIKLDLKLLKEYLKPNSSKKLFETKTGNNKIIYEMEPIPNSSNLLVNIIIEANNKLYLFKQELLNVPKDEKKSEIVLGGSIERSEKDLYNEDSLRIAWEVINEYFPNKLIVTKIISYSTQVVAGIIYKINFIGVDSDNLPHEINATVMDLVGGNKDITIN